MPNSRNDLCPECRGVSFSATPPVRSRSAGPTDPNDLCPVCNGPITGQCRCRRGNRFCANHHSWRVCKVHKVRVLGSGHDSKLPWDACCCPKHSTEKPGGSTATKAESADMSASVSFVFDLDDPVVKFH